MCKGHKYAGGVLRLEALPIVRDGETPSPSFANNFDPDLQILLAPVFNRIANQILKYHCELRTIRHQRWQFGYSNCCAGTSEVMCQVCQRDIKRLLNRDELRLLRRHTRVVQSE